MTADFQASRSAVLSLREPRKKGSVRVVGVSEYNPEGLRTVSIQLKKGTIVHITRDYYHLSPEELHNIVRDFLAFVVAVERDGEYRRAPGIHCTRCPFQELCETLRKGSYTHQEALQALPDPSGVSRYGLALQKPSSEVLEAISRREART